MTISLAHIWRHPIKSHGREALEKVLLEIGETMPWDRTWAVAHEASKANNSKWAPCANFSRGSKAPQLMAIEASVDEISEQVTLSHPDKPTITLHPEHDSKQLIDWVKSLMPENRAQSARILRVPQRGMTDTDYASISIANISSNQALSDQMNTDLSPKRWRANLWLDGLDAWHEFDWVGKTIQIGTAKFEILERIQRCMATTANPETGERDADTLAALQNLGHQDFGIYARVAQAGEIQLGDTVQVL